MTHHEETWLNANRNPNPKGGIYKTPIVPSTLLTTTYNALFESHTWDMVVRFGANQKPKFKWCSQITKEGCANQL